MHSKSLRSVRHFAASEDGAVAIDFVVLCAAVVGIGLMAVNAIYPTVQTAAEGVTPQTVAATGTEG